MSTDFEFLDALPDELSGHDVRLEKLTDAHADDLLAIGRDASVWRHLSHAPLATREDAFRFIASAQVQSPAGGLQHALAVFDLKSGRLAGTTRFLAIRPKHRGMEIGWTWYGVEFQRTHVNTATKLLLMTHAFEVMDCIRIEFKTDHLNERSQKAIERLGAKLEGTFRNHYIRPDGSIRHSVFYSITNEEWPAVKERLLGRLKETQLKETQ